MTKSKYVSAALKHSGSSDEGRPNDIGVYLRKHMQRYSGDFVSMLSRIVSVMLILAFGPILRSASATNIPTMGGEVDWSKGLVQETASSCGVFLFENSKSGAMFSLLVRGTEAAVCIFHEEHIVFHMPNDFGATIAGHTTLFSFTRVGNEIFVAWVRPYD